MELLATTALGWLGARKVSRMYRPGPDLELANGMPVEVKARATGWKLLERWLPEDGLLMLKADRRPFLVVMRPETLAKLMSREHMRD